MLRTPRRTIDPLAQRRRLQVSFVLTGIVCLLLVPVWLWQTKHLGFPLKSQSSAQAQEETNSIASVAAAVDEVTIPNPLEEISGDLQQEFARPVNVTSVTTTDQYVVVAFTASNMTFADLIAPFLQSYLSGGSLQDKLLPDKATTLSGEQLVPLVQPGQEKEGLLYFAKPAPGVYELHVAALRYDTDNQSPFDQTIVIRVEDNWLPRT